MLGPRVYVPNGSSDSVTCYDASTQVSCVNFPKSLSNLGLLYTVNADPARPTCIWVNSDDGASQIQNFDAYTGGACGEGAIRVLASSFVVNSSLCVPTSYSSLQVQAPPPTSYSSGTVAFEDADANPIAGVPTEPLDPTGTADLASLNLSTAFGLPEFLITLLGAQGAATSVVVQLTWTGVNDPSCVPGGGSPAVKRTVEFVHGINGNYLQFECRNLKGGFSAILAKLCADSSFNPESFPYYQDLGYAQNSGPSCPKMPAPVTSTGVLFVDPGSIDPSVCDSKGALAFSSAALHAHLASLSGPVSVVATSMGGAITRGWLALAATNGSRDQSLVAADSVIFLQGAQAGSWAAGVGEGLADGPAGALVEPISQLIGFNLNRPGLIDIAPQSAWYDSVNQAVPSPGVPPQLAYYNFYSNLSLDFQVNLGFLPLVKGHSMQGTW